MGNDYYLDGGLTKYLPAEVLLDKGADTIVGSSIQVVSTVSATEIRNMNRLNLAVRSLEIIQEQLNEYQLEHCDYAIRPKFNPGDWHRVDRLDHIITVGKTTAMEAISQFKTSGGLFS